MTVQLERGTWEVHDVIGRGGFGRVHAAAGPDGQPGALKLVLKDPSAERELLFADSESLHDAPNVVPIIDWVETRDEWVLAMPRADRSLRDELERQRSQPDTAVAILSNVAEAVLALDDLGVVHRDVKPENVLLLGGEWCLTDLGISR